MSEKKSACDSKKRFDELKTEWKKLWKERFDDKEKAEGVATSDYSSLFVDQGTIIHATRDFKALNFKEILDRNQLENTERLIQPDPNVGGWNKFIKTEISKKKTHKQNRAASYIPPKKEVQQPKKGGRGWLHK